MAPVRQAGFPSRCLPPVPRGGRLGTGDAACQEAERIPYCLGLMEKAQPRGAEGIPELKGSSLRSLRVICALSQGEIRSQGPSPVIFDPFPPT